MLPQLMKLYQIQSALQMSICKRHLNFLRYQSSYIQKMRLIQNLKDNNAVSDKILQNARFAVFQNFKPLVREKLGGEYGIPWKRFNEISTLIRNQQLVLLTTDSSTNNEQGFSPQAVSFVINIPTQNEETNEDLTGFPTEMRKAMFIISQEDTHILTQGYGLLKWHSMNSFCPNCGTKTTSDVVGSKRICEECTQVNYPKMAPIVIALVMDGDRCLVVRQPTFPHGMYSALAGFCEIGETIEMSTRREVAEEVGLLVEHVQYHRSRHWPFPSSGLMIGCYASIKPDTGHKLCIDEKELEDARWLNREEVKCVLESNTRSKPGKRSLWFPPAAAIAHHLIQHWAFNTQPTVSN